MSSPIIYFHSPCFDGIASAALATVLLKQSEKTRHLADWSAAKYVKAHYRNKDKWLSLSHNVPFAVVDFHYHPNAVLWADHHETTFLSALHQLEVAEDRHLNTITLYNPRAKSCAELLFNELDQESKIKYLELKDAASKIDSADYFSAEEAIFVDTPALRIERTLYNSAHEYKLCLIQELINQPLSNVASHPIVVRKHKDAIIEAHKGVNAIGRQLLECKNGIQTFIADTTHYQISRYAPFYLNPRCFYFVGIFIRDGKAKLTVSRNPWPPSIRVPLFNLHLGKFMKSYGGGGHHGIGSADLPESSNYEEILKDIVNELRWEITNSYADNQE